MQHRRRERPADPAPRASQEPQVSSGGVGEVRAATDPNERHARGTRRIERHHQGTEPDKTEMDEGEGWGLLISFFTFVPSYFHLL